MPTERELTYVGCLIDTEGTIAIHRESRKNSIYNYLACDYISYNYISHVAISNTNKKMLDYVEKVTGIGRVGENSRRIINKKHKIAYFWRLRIEEIREFLPILEPYILFKNEQAKLMIEFQKYMIGYSSVNLPTEHVLMMREIIYEEMKELNRRGPLTQEGE